MAMMMTLMMVITKVLKVLTKAVSDFMVMMMKIMNMLLKGLTKAMSDYSGDDNDDVYQSVEGVDEGRQR